jgi:hypothetical protein
MPESMDPKLVEQLDAICGAYARRKQLSKDDQQEVFDHLEDTLRNYLTGEARVTPEDALLLARARLGDVKGVLGQLRPERADNARIRARLVVAIATALLTVVVLPLTMLLLIPPAGRPSDFLRAFILLPLCFITLEGGVFLSARADVRSRWQRGVALVLIIPTILVFCAMLNSADRVVVPHGTLAGLPFGSILLRVLMITCLVGHGILALILLTPRKHTPPLSVG